MKHKLIFISAIIAVMLITTGIVVKVNSLNTVVDTEKLMIEDAPMEVHHEFVPNKQ